ncbi:MAG: Qat anti-phage system TatD family nuclease QatD [Chitinophagaceae bacterium]
MNTLVDMHCHLDLFQGIQINPSSEDNLGIKTITVTNAPSFFPKNKVLFEQSKNIRVALGLHPQLIATHALEYNQFKELVSETRYIGEIGLDGSPEYKSSFAAQMKVFENILLYLTKEPSKIVSVHSRNAANETISTIKKVLRSTEHRVILHWYSGSIIELDTAIKNGFYFSINHKMANSEKGKILITKIPNDRILTETDAPFTFSRSISSRIKSLEATLEGVAKIKFIDKDECAELVYTNFKAIIEGLSKL